MQRLDLGFNNLTSLEGLKSCMNLKWLSVVQNKLQSLKGIEGLTKLTVLNAGKNKLKSMDEVKSLASLRALILNDNEITSVCKLDQTILMFMLKHKPGPFANRSGSLYDDNNDCRGCFGTSNLLSSISGKSSIIKQDALVRPRKILGKTEERKVACMSEEIVPRIGKIFLGEKCCSEDLMPIKTCFQIALSLSNCQLQTVDSSLKSCLELKELRLAHNEIMTIPSEFGRLVKLQNLDMGNNLITNRSNIKVLSSLVNLRNLNLQGNPIAEKENLLKKVKKLLPNLHVFNARPIDKIVGKEMHEKVDDFSFEADKKLALQSETNIDQLTRNKNPRKTPPLSESMDNNLNSAGGLGSRKKRKELLDEKGVDSVENTNITEKKKKTKVKLQQNENNNAESLNLIPEEAKKSKHKKKKTNEAAEEPDVGLDSILTGKEPDKKSCKKTKGDKVNIIDSAETPFTDLFLTDAPEDRHEIADKKLDHKTGHDVHVITGLVTLPTKKKKKRNRIDPAALELSQVDEIGLGGPSAWDDN
ncbi:UNVERIFIED_CONTAM: hypothetical protein Sradi_0412700 [Sesamum radiatum]|uniref:Uncharacterized protein n=1 Tax=Sesamum radiatum TaxID=300843 RepID=A0AAW2W6I5_SESRA